MSEQISQEKVMQLRLLEGRLENMMKQREMLANRMAEIDSTLSSIDEVSKSKGDALFHVGGEAFMYAKPSADSKVLVMIGAEIALEKTPEEARKVLQERRKEADKIMSQLQGDIETASRELESFAAHMDHDHDGHSH